VNLARLCSRQRSLFVAELVKDVDGLADGPRHDLCPDAFRCPITHEIMTDPVVATDGFSYEREALLDWFRQGNPHRSPMTGLQIAGDVHPNQSLRTQIREWREGQDQSRGSSSSQDRTSRFTIFCKGPWQRGRTLPIYAWPGCTVEDLKVQIEEKEHIPRAIQVLRGELGRLLPEGEDLVRHFGLEQDATVYVSMDVSAGGGFAFNLSSARTVVVQLEFAPQWFGQFGGTASVVAAPGETVGTLLFRLWTSRGRPSRLRPADCTLWHGLKDVGDGVSRGYPMKLDDEMHSFATPVDRGTIRWQIEVQVKKRHIPFESSEQKHKTWSRLGCVKRLYDHFVNRVEAYNFATDVGLVLFSSKASLTCKPTPLIEDFRDQVERAKCFGDTAAFDAVKLAAETLQAWRDEQLMPRSPGSEPPVLRILVLSDGADTKSSAVPWKVAKELQQSNITLDMIHVGTSAMDPELHMLAKCTGGYVFKPSSVRDALRINELETVLHGPERPVLARKPLRVTCESDLRAFHAAQYPVDMADDTAIPPRRQPTQLSHRAVPLASAISSLGSGSTEGAQGHHAGDAVGNIGGDARAGGGARARQRRLLREMRSLMQSAHPNFDVYPCESDVGFWRLVLAMDQPTDLFTPYAQGCWLLYIMFPEEYPERPPEVRFVTPIRHCNVNAHGRICHSILDRNYTTDTPISKILESVYALVLSPDPQDAVDASLAHQCHADLDAYRRAINEHVQRHASARSREAWREALNENAEKAGVPGADEVSALSPASSLQELRAFIVRHELPILTGGRGRTKAAVFRDILEYVGRQSSRVGQ